MWKWRGVSRSDSNSSRRLATTLSIVRVVDGEKTRMLVIPEGQVTEVGDITWVSSDLVQYTLTIDCFTPEDGAYPDNPQAVNEYIDEPDVEDESS